MSLIFIMVAAIVVAVFVIRKKISAIHDHIEDKIHSLTAIAERGGELSALASNQVIKQAKKALQKAKK